ncbi:hypothetical protein NZD89_25705 [Alicyclobacillus fastidiosus]|uniref:DUF3592 domain-containing protein n=1 Tax=Alicyclobacillus fastidiosus TaxID=392011 RepID=A0ABY6ZHJ1_9BACL|nr:hypothetical protein [Alicyclobacillus fastidiosus]WAH41594.1 hypothetical protein NZD89_25705 [Alicyclobacillus fastidiosus]
MRMRLVKRRGRLPYRVVFVILAIVGLGLFEAYRLVMPYVARNPMYHEVTIGEPVIDKWNYDGEDEEGYLKFYNTSSDQVAVLPPTSKLFGADGKFVVIERADSGSLTYASPLESAPPIWYAVMVMFVGAAIWLIMYRLSSSRKHRMHLRKAPPFSSALTTPHPSGQTRRFRPSKRQKSRFFR